jgi:hypothetical protein
MVKSVVKGKRLVCVPSTDSVVSVGCRCVLGSWALGLCSLWRSERLRGNRCFARSGTSCAQLRGCPPACGLLLDAAALCTPSARAANRFGCGTTLDRPLLRESRFGWGKSVDRPPLRKSWSMVYSAQRHKGGVVCPRQTRGTAAELSTPSACSGTKIGQVSPGKITTLRFAAVQASQPP